jgi:hypothetical protein
VVRSEDPATLGPVAVLRLLATAGDAVLVVPRPDGRGLDIPTVEVTDDPASALDRLHEDALGRRGEPTLVGFVRNTVPEPTEGYPWPVPVACFAVWNVAVERTDARAGEWLEPPDVERQLAERHWWPLREHLVRPARTTGTTRHAVRPPGVASGHG